FAIVVGTGMQRPSWTIRRCCGWTPVVRGISPTCGCHPLQNWRLTMPVLFRRTFAGLVFAAGLLVLVPVAVPTSAAADDKGLVNALPAGGLVIVVRHGATFPDQADTDPFHPDNIAAQRNLNDKGKGLAKAFGDALRQMGVPVGKVYTSLFNRAYETAVLAGFT